MIRGKRIALAIGVIVTGALVTFVVATRVAPDHAERAAAAYAARCAYCHDVEGNIGMPLDERVVRGYGTARRLYDYVRLAMPYDRPRTLPDHEIWLSVSYLIRSRGLAAQGAVIDAESADRVVFMEGG